MSGDREIIAVIGPSLSGVTSVAGALRERLGRYRVVEQLRSGEKPVAVVFIVSAAAPMTESDAQLLDTAAANTDAVVAAVSKIDVHRGWPRVLAANRAMMAGYATRYAGLTWATVAADPHVGPPKLDQLVDTVLAAVASGGRNQRNPLRTRESRGKSRAVQLLALRSQVQQARVRIAGQARVACVALRTELRHEAAEVARGGIDQFCTGVLRRAERVAAEVDATVTRQLMDMADGVGLASVDAAALTLSATASPALESALPSFVRPRAQNRLTILLSAGFGLGVTLTAGRLLADLAPAWTRAVTVGALVAGSVLTGWVIRTRGLLAERAALDRWVPEVTAGLRSVLEDHLLTVLLAAESALAAASATRELPASRGCLIEPGSDRT